MEELHRKLKLNEGHHDLIYRCGCSSERIVPFDYDVIQELVEHSGQGVDGCSTERVYIKSNIPEMAQCKSCGRVARITMQQMIFEDGRNSRQNLYTGEVIEKADMSLIYPIARLKKDLENVFGKIVVEPLGIPRI